MTGVAGFDTIDLGPGADAPVLPAALRHGRASAHYEQRLARTVELLRQAAAEHAGTVVQASSLGVEDMVLSDLIHAQGLDIRVATLDTGALHLETLELIGRVRRHYGIDVEIWRPAHQAVLEFVGRNGPDAMYRSIPLRKACCAVRKLEPLGRMLDGRSAWITGLRREQSAQRVDVGEREVGADGRVKFNPLAQWSLGDVWHYVALHGVPYNPLHDRFYPSIGCEPCTRAVAVGEDQRAGRWWWELEGAKECGLHPEGRHAVGAKT